MINKLLKNESQEIFFHETLNDKRNSLFAQLHSSCYFKLLLNDYTSWYHCWFILQYHTQSKLQPSVLQFRHDIVS